MNMTAIAAGLVCAVLTAVPVVCAGTIYWTPAHELAPQGCGSRMAAADLDADGDCDISIVGIEEQIEQFWNIGSATEPLWQLDSSQFGEVTYCSNRGGDFGDLDADGDLDLVMGCYYETFQRFYWNTGTPTMPQWEEDLTVFQAIDIGTYEKIPELADMDADGDLDLLVCDGWGRIRYTPNTGSSTAPEFEGYSDIDEIPYVNGSIPSVALGDLDGDGDLDIVRVTVDTAPECFENIGSAQVFEFVANADLLAGVELRIDGAWGVELFDVDGDGDPDIIFSVGLGYENLLFLNGGATPVESTSWGTIKAMYR